MRFDHPCHRRHRRGEIQLHRTLSFLKTGHTKILPFGLQENVRSPLPDKYAVLRARVASGLEYLTRWGPGLLRLGAVVG